MVGAAGGNRVVTVLGHPAQINTAPGAAKADATVSLHRAEHPVFVAIISKSARVTDQQVQSFAATLTTATPTTPGSTAEPRTARRRGGQPGHLEGVLPVAVNDRLTGMTLHAALRPACTSPR